MKKPKFRIVEHSWFSSAMRKPVVVYRVYRKGWFWWNYEDCFIELDDAKKYVEFESTRSGDEVVE